MEKFHKIDAKVETGLNVIHEGTLIISEVEWNDPNFDIILNRKLETLGELIRKKKHGET